MSELIRTENIKKTYKLGMIEVQAIKGVSLKINKGELVSIMGPSGSGKSTLMHLLGCLDTPTSGKYFLDNEDVSSFNEDKLAEVRNRKIGFVFQTFNLLSYLTVLENVLLPVVYNSNSDIKKMEERAKKLLDDMGIFNRIKHLPNQLSGGERQRVAIARALINDPVIVFADEPTGNLDTKTGLEIVKILRNLSEDKGVTEIIVTHDPYIAKFTQRVIHINDGVVINETVNNTNQVVYNEERVQ